MADIFLDTLSYYKTESDEIATTETTRVNTELDKKSNISNEGSPGGIATLDGSGNITTIEIPFASQTEADDSTEATKIINPEQLHYVLRNYSTTTDLDSAYGDLKSDGSVQMAVAYNPQDSKDIATVEYVQ